MVPDNEILSKSGSSDQSRNSSLENSHNLRDKWPQPSHPVKISVSPAKEIEKIPESSPLIWSTGRENPAFWEDNSKSEDENDSSLVYKSTTTALPQSTSGSDSSPLLGSPARASVPSRAKAWILQKKHALTSIDFTRRQWLIMFILATVTLTSSFAVCLFPPFFPKIWGSAEVGSACDLIKILIKMAIFWPGLLGNKASPFNLITLVIAQSKGASTTVFGLIIGTNCLVAFLVTPTVGKNLEKIGVKFCFVMGAFSSGCCCILSGFLEWFPPGYKFVLEAVLIRAVHACSNAFVITSTFAFIVVEFPDHIAKMFALTRMTMNLAQMLGPIVGGALYELGGFKLPFLVLGSVQIVVALTCIKILPRYKKKAGECETSNDQTISIFDVIKIPGMWISFCTFIFSTMSNGFLSITLEPMVLRKFNISNLHVGVLFGLKDGANSLASPVWGYLCDRKSNLRVLILVSTILAACSFVLLGPFPGLPFDSSYTLVVTALVLNGFGIGGQQVAGVVHAINMAVDAELPDNAATHGFVAGLWSSLSGAGRFISRAGSGFLVDQIGFRITTAIVVVLHCIVFLVTAAFLIAEPAKNCTKKLSQKSLSSDGDSDPTEHGPDCDHNVCVCNARGVVTTIEINTPSESLSTKAITIPMPGMREDLEGSMAYGSYKSSRASATSLTGY